MTGTIFKTSLPPARIIYHPPTKTTMIRNDTCLVRHLVTPTNTTD